MVRYISNIHDGNGKFWAYNTRRKSQSRRKQKLKLVEWYFLNPNVVIVGRDKGVMFVFSLTYKKTNTLGIVLVNWRALQNYKATYTTVLLYTMPPFNKLNLSGLWPMVLSSTACQLGKIGKCKTFQFSTDL